MATQYWQRLTVAAGYRVSKTSAAAAGGSTRNLPPALFGAGVIRER